MACVNAGAIPPCSPAPRHDCSVVLAGGRGGCACYVMINDGDCSTTLASSGGERSRARPRLSASRAAERGGKARAGRLFNSSEPRQSARCSCAACHRFVCGRPGQNPPRSASKAFTEFAASRAREKLSRSAAGDTSVREHPAAPAARCRRCKARRPGRCWWPLSVVSGPGRRRRQLAFDCAVDPFLSLTFRVSNGAMAEAMFPLDMEDGHVDDVEMVRGREKDDRDSKSGREERGDEVGKEKEPVFSPLSLSSLLFPSSSSSRPRSCIEADPPCRNRMPLPHCNRGCLRPQTYESAGDEAEQ